MKKMLGLLAALLTCTLLALDAHARSSVPLAEFENMPAVAASGQPASSAQIKAAIEAAAQQHDWTVVTPAPGRMVATLQVRNKHTVVTEILYKPGQYSVQYKDSVNMNFDPSTRVIHPFYNKWVQGLVDDIRKEAARR
jgi:hypothetical protein